MLRARDLWVAAPGLDHSPVVRGFSLEVGRGEWVALTGPNGGGKSRLVLALAGLAPIVRGTLELDGQPFGPLAPQDLKAGVSVVLQDPSCQLLERTVAEEVALTAQNLGRSEEETAGELSRHYRVHAPDLPGFGSSCKPALGSYDARWFTEIMLGLMDEHAHTSLPGV